MRTLALEEHFRSSAFRALQGTGAARGRTLPAEVLEKLDDVGEPRLQDMADAGVDVQVLSHIGLGEQLGSDDAMTVPREANDELASLVRAHPGAYRGFALLPVSDPEEAAEELRRSALELGLQGAMIHGTIAGRFLDDDRFWPIFAAAADLGVPLYLHPAPPPRDVFESYYAGFTPELSAALATSAWGWHVETGLHVLRLILGGVFDRHPRLQVIVGHMGEALPYMLARLDERLGEFAKLERRPADYLRQNVHYTISGFFTEAPLRCLLDVVGVDRLMFAVDYPFSANDVAVRFLRSAPLSDEDREKISHVNAEALLRI